MTGQKSPILQVLIRIHSKKRRKPLGFIFLLPGPHYTGPKTLSSRMSFRSRLQVNLGLTPVTLFSRYTYHFIAEVFFAVFDDDPSLLLLGMKIGSSSVVAGNPSFN